MKIVFISSSLAIVWCMRQHPLVRRTYDKDLDTFRHYILVVISFVLALLFHDRLSLKEVNLITHSVPNSQFDCKWFRLGISCVL
jgi:ER lumen protein retaining receptor